MELETVSAEKFGIEEVKAKQIREQFEPMLKQMEVLEVEANKVFQMKKGTPEAEGKAKEVRLKLVKVRTGTALIHKEQKDFYLKAGRFIDGWKNAQIFAGQGIEEKLLEIENYTKIKLAEKIEALNKKRSNQIEKYINLEQNDLNFGTMQDDVWTAYLEKKKSQYLELIEAEKEAELKRKEDEKNAVIGQERFVELLEFVVYLKRKYTLTECTEMTQDQFDLLKVTALQGKTQDEIGKKRFVEVANYVNYLEKPITYYDFKEMTEFHFENFLSNLIQAEKNQQELERRKDLISPFSRFISDENVVLDLDLEGFNQFFTCLVAKDSEEKEIERRRALILPYSRFVNDIERVLRLDVMGFAEVMAVSVEKDKEEKKIKEKREDRGKKLSAMLYFIDDYEGLINSTDKEFKKGLAEAQERADKKTEELRLQATKESEDRAERTRLQGIENDRSAKEAQDAKNAEKLAKAPVKKQFQAWIKSMTLENAPVDNELSSEILKKFEGFKEWAKKEVEKL